MPHPVIIPLLNPNEPEALLAGLHIEEGQQVAKDDLLCSLETTKSATELHAETGGFVAGLRFAQGDTVRAGERLCYLAESPDWVPPAEAPPAAGKPAPPEAVPAGLRITQPAMRLAQSAGLDLGSLPTGPLVTEEIVRARLARQPGVPAVPPEPAFDPTAVIVYGGGGHGKSLIDLLRALGTYRVVGVVDDGLHGGETIFGVPVLGGAEVLPGLLREGVHLAINAVGGIGNIQVRIEVFRRLAQAGFVCPPVVHPTAFLEATASLAAGVQVLPHAYVGSAVEVGYGAIVNTGVIVSHDCKIGPYANLAPGAILAGEVEVGTGTLIGMGVTVNLGVTVGAGARIGNGATVKQDIPENGVVRAGTIWPK